jgi:hypothetical protein
MPVLAGASGGSLPSSSGHFCLFEPAVLQWLRAKSAAASSTTSLLLDSGPTGSFNGEQMADLPALLPQLKRVCLTGDLTTSRAYDMLSESIRRCRCAYYVSALTISRLTGHKHGHAAVARVMCAATACKGTLIV